MIENARYFTEHSANHLWQHLDSKKLSETAYMCMGRAGKGESLRQWSSDGGLVGLGNVEAGRCRRVGGGGVGGHGPVRARACAKLWWWGREGFWCSQMHGAAQCN